MTNHASIYFQYKDRMFSISAKTSVKDMTLPMLEERMYKKLGLDEHKEKLEMSYIPMVVGCELPLAIVDDEDLFVYLTSIDKENRRSLLFVESCGRAEPVDKLSIVRKSSVGMNYEDLQPLEEEIGHDAITLYVGEKQGNIELIEDDDDRTQDDCMDMNIGMENETGMETTDTGMETTGKAAETETGIETARETDTTPETGTVVETDTAPGTVVETNTAAQTETGEKYVEQQPEAESAEYIKEWGDGLTLNVHDEFPNKKTIQEIVDRAAYSECYHYLTKKSDRKRLVVGCSQPNCKWGLRAARIRETEIFSIRSYTKMHTCSRTNQSNSNDKRRGSTALVAAFLNEKFPGDLETPSPIVIKGLVHFKLGANISYSTPLTPGSMTPLSSFSFVHPSSSPFLSSEPRSSSYPV